MSRLLLVTILLAAGTPLLAQTTAGGDAYLDATARELVAGARERRATIDLSIQEYRALSTDRISVGHRALGRERVLFRRETATRMHWRRDGDIDLEVLGARELSPAAGGEASVPGDLADYLHVAFDPLDSEFLFRFDTIFTRHPFAAGSEQHYRFATGDSSTIRLPDGREVRLRELRVIPRRAEPQLVSGSFWLHSGTNAVVQATFRPANEYRMSFARSRRNVSVGIGPAGSGRTPWFLRSVRGSITQISMDYGLWELRWWLPRYVRIAGTVELAALGAVGMQYELGYSDYDIVADTTRARTALDPAAVPCHGVRRIRHVQVVRGPDSLRNVWEEKAEQRRTADSSFIARRATRADSLARIAAAAGTATGDSGARPRSAAAADSAARAAARAATADSLAASCARTYRVSALASVDSLLESEVLPASIYEDAELLTRTELEQLEDRLGDIPGHAVQLGNARLEFGLAQGLTRYNRIEGLSVGARGVLDLGAGEASIEARYGIADEAPKGVAQLTLRGAEREWRLQGYRELRTTDPLDRPFLLTNSVGALLLGQEHALFYRGTGAALAVAPPGGELQSYGARAYIEHQAPVRKNTNFSVAHLLNDAHRFSENITAQRATQFGAEFTLRRDAGIDPESWRAGAELGVRAETGDFDFLRPSLTLRFNPPPLGPLVPGLEASAGTTFGDAPVQSFWYLGGARTLRGYLPGDAAGEAFWRGRGELATAFPGVRAAVFTDLGWAGAADGDAWRRTRALWSAGAGLSVLDGLLRLDVAKPLRGVEGSRGWRAMVYMNGVL